MNEFLDRTLAIQLPLATGAAVATLDELQDPLAENLGVFTNVAAAIQVRRERNKFGANILHCRDF